jgi:phosphoglucosamine mutase
VKRLFGTDGIRGAAGRFPLDDATVEAIGRALAATLRDPAGNAPRLLIGRDTRESGPAIEAALGRGLAGGGARYESGGVLTTPAVACLTRILSYDAGIVVSASHNPYRDNGLKVFDRAGGKIPDALEATIERLVLDPDAGAGARAGDRAGDSASGAGDQGVDSAAGRPVSPGRPTAVDPRTLAARYLDWLRTSLPAGTSFAGWKVVLDCAHGAAARLGPDLFRSLGAEVVAIHCDPDGRNINAGCGALHPEALAATVVRERARIGFAFDGDADRCLVVDASGRVLTGDHVLFLAARDLRAAGRLKGDTVVGTVMSNLWIDLALRAEGMRLLRAPVGDKYVLEEMRRGGYALGGEQSGHLIFLDRATTGDGLLSAILVLDLLRRAGIDLATWAASIRPCPQVLVNVRVRERPPIDDHPAIGPAVRAEQDRLGTRGRVLVRYSGTEPLARIMVEGESQAAVDACVERLRAVIRDAIGSRDPA